MKKIGVYIILGLLLLGLFSFASAQTIRDIEDKKEDLQDKAQTAKDTVTDEEVRNEYLKREWKKFFEENENLKFLAAISNFLEKLDPLFLMILGVEYSFSLAFVFALVLWTTLFYFIGMVTKAITENTLAGIIGGFVMASLVGISGVIKQGVDFLNFMITNTWIFWLSIILTAVFVFIMYKLGFITKEMIENQKKQSEEEELQRSKELIKLQGRIVRKSLEE